MNRSAIKMGSYLSAALAVALAGCAASTAPTATTTPDTTTTTASTALSPASKAPLVAIVTRAEWCSVCKANGARAGKVLMQGASSGAYEVVMNDITNDDTTTQSMDALRLRGLADVAAGASPGTISFVDSRTRRRVAEVTVAHQDGEILQVISLAEKRATH